MKSRYNYMEEGSVRDSVSGDFYPDPLTLNYHNFQMNSNPIPKELSETDIARFWVVAHQAYGVAELDDMILGLNGIPHKNLLKDGDIIYIPSRDDIDASFRKE
jgi:hypothetical protein